MTPEQLDGDMLDHAQGVDRPVPLDPNLWVRNYSDLQGPLRRKG